MSNSQTIDTVVSNVSIPRKIWNKGKYVLIALGVAYVLNGGYHLVQAAITTAELKVEEQRIEFNAIMCIGYFDARQDSRMPEEKSQKKFDEKLRILIETNKMPELVAQRNYHLYSALNPFH